MKIFLDTNVLVSAFATRGLSADLLELVSLRHELLTGEGVLKEFVRVLRTKLKVPVARCAEAAEAIQSESAFVARDVAPAECTADTADRLVLGEAIAGGADMVVTGDSELLRLGSIGSVRIVSPRQLWDLLSEP